MARKHNTRHNRSRSRYPERLAARGETTATVRMPFIDGRGRKHETPGHMLTAEGKRRSEDD